MSVKHAVITGFLSKTRDRFNEYNEERNLEERSQVAASINGIEGVEAVFPYEVSDHAIFRLENRIFFEAIYVAYK